MSGAHVRFSVPGKAVGKARARVALRRGTVVAYTPAETRRYEAAVRAAAALAVREPIDGPVAVRIDVSFCPPPSWSKRRREEAVALGLPHAGRPDLDNVIKSVLDGLSGIAFADDRQVVEIVAAKKYGDADVTRIAVVQFQGCTHEL